MKETKNRVVFIGIAVLVGFQALFIFAPFMHDIFGSAALDGRQLLLALLVGASVLPIISLEKAIRRAHRKSSPSATPVRAPA